MQRDSSALDLDQLRVTLDACTLQAVSLEQRNELLRSRMTARRREIEVRTAPCVHTGCWKDCCPIMEGLSCCTQVRLCSCPPPCACSLIAAPAGRRMAGKCMQDIHLLDRHTWHCLQCKDLRGRSMRLHTGQHGGAERGVEAGQGRPAPAAGGAGRALHPPQQAARQARNPAGQAWAERGGAGQVRGAEPCLHLPHEACMLVSICAGSLWHWSASHAWRRFLLLNQQDISSCQGIAGCGTGH